MNLKRIFPAICFLLICSLQFIPVSGKMQVVPVLKKDSYAQYIAAPEKALEYYQKALHYYQKTGDQEKMGYMYFNIAKVYYSTGELNLAIHQLNNSADCFRQVHSHAGTLNALNMLGVIYGDLGWSDKSLQVYLEALHLLEKFPDSVRMGIVLSNIAGIYGTFLKKDSALVCNLRSLEILKHTKDQKAYAYVLNNIGIHYMDVKDYDKAMVYFLPSLEIKVNIKDYQGQVFTLCNMGEIYLALHDFPGALDVLNKAMKLAAETKDPLSLGVANQSLGKYHLARNEFSQSIFYFRKSLDISRLIKFRGLELDNLLSLSQALEKTKHPKEALAFYHEYDQLKDSIFIEKSQKAIAEMSARFETAVKEKRILELEAENMLKAARIAKSRTLILTLTVGISLALILLLIILYTSSQKLKAYRQLVKIDLESIVPVREPVKPILTDDFQEKLAHDLVRMMDEEHLFLNPEITLADVSKKLNTNTAYLSRTMNEKIGNNFNNFINQYRINEAKRLLIDKAHQHLSIEGIAKTAGFKSKSVFNAAFKKMTGVTPSFYQRSAREMLDENSI